MRPLARLAEVIASTEGTAIASTLEWVAWEQGVTAAKRQAFVADGASSIWVIHKKYFSQMTGILDLMHALSNALRAFWTRWQQKITGTNRYRINA